MPRSQSDDRSEPRRRLPSRRLCSGVPRGQQAELQAKGRHPSAGISAQPRRRRRRCQRSRPSLLSPSFLRCLRFLWCRLSPAAPPVVVLAELAGASFRHPVTVTFLSALGVLVCGVGGCCAVMATVAKPTIVVNTPVQILFVMLPPRLFGLQRSDRTRARSTLCRCLPARVERLSTNTRVPRRQKPQ